MIQHRAACFVTGKLWRRDQRDSITNILTININWPTLQEHRRQATLVLLLLTRPTVYLLSSNKIICIENPLFTQI